MIKISINDLVVFVIMADRIFLNSSTSNSKEYDNIFFDPNLIHVIVVTRV
jgi:hypothetical protein